MLVVEISCRMFLGKVMFTNVWNDLHVWRKVACFKCLREKRKKKGDWGIEALFDIDLCFFKYSGPSYKRLTSIHALSYLPHDILSVILAHQDESLTPLPHPPSPSEPMDEVDSRMRNVI